MCFWFQWVVKLFHVEQNKFLYTAKDHLVSSEEFDIFWNEEEGYALTAVPNEIDLKKYYQAESYNSHKTEKHTLLDFIYVFVQKLMLSYKARFIKQNNATVLDYGSGVGVFANYLKNRGFTVTAVEPSDIARKACIKKGLNSYETIDYISESTLFSVITLWHVLEHVPDLNKTLAQLNNKIQCNGTLIIAVPNLKSYDAKHYKSYWAALDVPRHLWHFTDIGLIKLLESSGFAFQSTHPLWFDALYISYLSESQKGSSFAFIKGLFVGVWSNLKALFNGQYSSKIYIFKKTN